MDYSMIPVTPRIYDIVCMYMDGRTEIMYAYEAPSGEMSIYILS
jgi:hypothetical protein